MALQLNTVSGFVTIELPGGGQAAGQVESCIFDGFTLKLDGGDHIRAFHDLIKSGQVHGLAIILKDENGNNV